MSIKTVLVPTDFSEHAKSALVIACDLATQLGAKLKVLYVQSGSVLRTAVQENLLGDATTDEELQKAVEESIEQRFSGMLSCVDRSQIEIEHLSQRGDPGAVIVTYAKEIGADLVVVGRRGTGLIEDVRAAVLGSVAATVIRESPCPVLVVRREHQDRG